MVAPSNCATVPVAGWRHGSACRWGCCCPGMRPRPESRCRLQGETGAPARGWASHKSMQGAWKLTAGAPEPGLALALGPRQMRAGVFFQVLDDQPGHVLAGGFLDAGQARRGIYFHHQWAVVGAQDID